MAEIGNLINVIALKLQGDLAGWTTYTNRRGKITFYPQAPPLDPPSWAQQYQRLHFSQAASAWNYLSQADRDNYERSAKEVKATITGYNLWMSAALIGDDTGLVAVEKKTGRHLARPWVSE